MLRTPLITRFKPAYIKMKDAVNPFSLVRRTPGELAMLQPLDQQTRYDAIVAEIVQNHRRAWENRLEYMAAKAILDGKLTVNFDDGQSVLVDFGRAAGNTIVKPHGSTWAAANSPDIVGDIKSWRTIVQRAQFSGPVDRITFGPDAWSAFKKDPTVQAQLSTISRGTVGNVAQSALNGAEVKYMGTWDGLDCYLYAGYYHDASGASQQIMGSKDILLSGQAVQGVRAFASIQDKNAQWQPLSIFSRMYDTDDPGVTYILTQSAPLTVPVNVNNTMKVTVLE